MILSDANLVESIHKTDYDEYDVRTLSMTSVELFRALQPYRFSFIPRVQIVLNRSE